MSTYNSVFVPTRFKSVENAEKTNKGLGILERVHYTSYNNKVYRRIWMGAMRGKVKDFIESHSVCEYCGSDYNGYGWSNHNYDYYMTEADGKAFMELVENRKAAAKPAKTDEEKQEAWCKRLVKLLSTCDEYSWVTIDVARKIAEEKLEYKEKQIRMVDDRQYEHYSVRRQSLINKMERENPLRRIENEEHAIRIMIASNRHKNTNYEDLLDEYREQANRGEIYHDDVKFLARQNYV